jgi:hypothetical protein
MKIAYIIMSFRPWKDVMIAVNEHLDLAGELRTDEEFGDGFIRVFFDRETAKRIAGDNAVVFPIELPGREEDVR